MVTKIKVSDLIAEFLEKSGIDTVFGIIGSANSHIFDSIQKRNYTKIICVHHEQSAVMAMGAYFRSSGKMSAAIVTAGAGSSNAITGVVSNWADSIPGIIISGQEQSYHLSNYDGMRMYGIQGFNSSKMVSEVTKYSKTVTDENSIQAELENAYTITNTPRQGPVWIDVPFDVQAKSIIPREWNLVRTNIPLRCDAEPVLIQWDEDYVLKQLSESKRPLIWGGHGIRLSGAKNQFRSLIERLQIPTILTWSGIDLLPDNHPLYFGRAGVTGMRHSNFIVQNCDLLLVIGSRLSLLQTGYDITKFAPKAKIIIVDIDETEWKKHPAQKYDRIIQEDCSQFINHILPKSSPCNVPEWMGYCQRIKSKYPVIEDCHQDGGTNYLNSYRFVDKLNDYIDDNAIIVTDMGTGLLSGHHSIKIKQEQTMFTSLGLGEMGYGLPGAIGASIANPSRQVICLNCDGGMMMNLQELQTIVHHNLPIKIVVFNNDGYLMIKHTQNMLFNGNRTSVNTDTGLSLPNYQKVGTSFGINSYRLNNWEDFDKTVSDWLSNKTPSILEVFMNPDQEFLPKVKGVVNQDNTISPAPLEEMSPLLPLEQVVDAMISGLSEKSKSIKR